MSFFSGEQAEMRREGLNQNHQARARENPRRPYSIETTDIQFGKWNIHSDSRGYVGSRGRGGMGELRAEVTGREGRRGTDQSGWVFTNSSV